MHVKYRGEAICDILRAAYELACEDLNISLVHPGDRVKRERLAALLIAQIEDGEHISDVHASEALRRRAVMNYRN